MDDRDGKTGAVLACDTVDQAGRVIFGKRRQIEPQRCDQRRAIGHARIGIDHPRPRGFDIDRAARGLQVRSQPRGNSACEQDPSGEILAPAARMDFALVVAAQVDDRLDPQRVDRG